MRMRQRTHCSFPFPLLSNQRINGADAMPPNWHNDTPDPVKEQRPVDDFASKLAERIGWTIGGSS
jgi:hypothetical protein